MGERIRVLVVDDHDVIRQGLCSFVETLPELELAGAAANGQQAVEFCQREPLGLILIDLMMPVLDGVEAIRQIRAQQPRLPIIALTNRDDSSAISHALQAGATSYLLKNTPLEKLAQAIRATLSGRRILAPEATEALIQLSTQPPVPAAAGYGLTDREREVLVYLVKGLTNQRIANALYVSRSTIKFHVASIFSKLKVTNRAEAVSLALQHHLVE